MKRSGPHEAFGLREDILARLRQVFARFDAIEAVVLFGSRARGDERHRSDLDLCLRGEGLTSSDEAHIARCIDDLMLPWKVDLILDHRLQHQAMRDNIDREGVIFYRREAPDRS